jgi:outer membrane lipoprotein-sorting protein
MVAFSCAHQAPKENKIIGQKVKAWRGKALIFDKIKDRKNTISLDVISKYPRLLRMDISAVLGIFIGSFTWNESQMQVLLAREKKFISGPANSNSMQELLKLQIDPTALLNIFWDENLSSNEWTCIQENLLPKSCKHKNLEIMITWHERAKLHRLVEIDSPKVNAQLSLTQLEEDVNLNANTFQLKAPANFQKMDLK